MTDHVLVSDTDGVRTITLNRADKRNALTADMYAAMAAALTSAPDAGIRAILFTGAGGFFTGGNDIGDFLANPPSSEDAPVFRFLAAIATTPLPVVAAVEGMAVGVGTTMLLHCDLVYAAPDARLHVPFVDLGLVPEAASSILMPRTMGHAQAARMLMLGEPLGAEEALATGILSGIVPAADLAATALAKARALAAKPVGAMRQTKALMRPGQAEVLATMKKEAAIFGACLRSPEAMAAFQAFMTKGKK
ncbi:enoyl-CoA hydratase-related protein [Niveispirillum sp.]|uniref:enoyl-CoA hydratase-related protein n=1 Tax=Niveispirillum sp. TaxID=1917217 RepID=UPI001B7796D0|nr:enoyl-CoA hydratase-related protein [Niveispirillum sp.]MBP7340041.1 enoyl-CoA hydratase/isomerase family protein [Niveispirillum sp.]